MNSSNPLHEIDAIMIPILPKRKPRPEEHNAFVQGHTAEQQQSLCSNKAVAI